MKIGFFLTFSNNSAKSSSTFFLLQESSHCPLLQFGSPQSPRCSPQSWVSSPKDFELSFLRCYCLGYSQLFTICVENSSVYKFTLQLFVILQFWILIFRILLVYRHCREYFFPNYCFFSNLCKINDIFIIHCKIDSSYLN